MFAVIYSFEVKPNKVEQFKKAWSNLTKMIFEYEGSLGSRLHQESEFKYVAYAQWPEKRIWENAGNKMPKSVDDIRARMKDSCDKIETVFELDMIEDQLQPL